MEAGAPGHSHRRGVLLRGDASRQLRKLRARFLAAPTAVHERVNRELPRCLVLLVTGGDDDSDNKGRPDPSTFR